MQGGIQGGRKEVGIEGKKEAGIKKRRDRKGRGGKEEVGKEV